MKAIVAVEHAMLLAIWNMTTTGALHQPAHSFTGLLDHLATLTRNHLRVAGHDESGFDLLAVPTPTQRRAFELLGAPIPLAFK